MKNKEPSSKNSQKEMIKAKPGRVEKQKALPTKYGGLFLWILILGGLLIAGYFALRMYGEEVKTLTSGEEAAVTVPSEGEELKKPVSDKEKLNILEDKLKHLEEKVEKYAASERELVATVGEIAALNARLNMLEARTVGASIIESTALGVMEETFNDKEKRNNLVLKKIETRLAAVENSLHIREELGQNGFGVLTTFAALQKAVLSGYVYVDQIKAFEGQYPFKDDIFQESIKVLEPYSEKGLVTPTQLFLLFPNLADEMYKTNRPASQTMWQEVKNKIIDLVSIRPIVPNDGSEESFSSYLFEMETFLSRGDIPQALDIFNKLPFPAQQVGRSWAESAKAYIQAEQAIHKLEALVFWRALGRVPVSIEKKPSVEKENSAKEQKDNT